MSDTLPSNVHRSEIDVEIENELASLLDQNPATPTLLKRHTRPSLNVVPTAELELISQEPLLQQKTKSKKPQPNSLKISTASTPVSSQAATLTLSPESYLRPSTGIGAGQKNVSTASDSHRPKELSLRPKSSTSNVSGFTLRPVSGLSKRPPSSLSIHSSVLAIPDNVRHFMIKAIDRARGIRRGTPDPLDSPCSSVSDLKVSVISQDALRRRLDSFYIAREEGADGHPTQKRSWWKNPHWPWKKSAITCNYYIDPQGDFYFVWMLFITLAFLYNALFIPVRAAFTEKIQLSYLLPMWFVFDYIFDILFFVDIVLIQSHLSYADQGLLVNDLTLISVRYYCSLAFVMDAAAIIPTDILYAIPVLSFNALIRLNRLLKIRGYKIFIENFESRTTFPHLFRLFKIVSVFIYIIHVNTCLYYEFSKIRGLGTTTWVYSGNGTSYVRCFYWSLLSIATINDNLPDPTNTPEWTFTMFNYILGVFVMALLISEMTIIWESYDFSRRNFRRKWDRIKDYMSWNHIPKEIQERVQAWYNYASAQQSILGEHVALKTLPRKMKADVAIHVHLETLSKVTLFQDCEKTLLRELVLKLKPVLFVPNDYICKKGEIGKEMFIVHKGLVAVVGGASDNEVLAELRPGSIFGEISLLAIGGGNRRSASVLSIGFSTLFVLSKKDLHSTLDDYPEAQESLEKKARYLLHKDKKRESDRQRQRGLTQSAQKLSQDIRGNQMAKRAVAAMANAAKKKDEENETLKKDKPSSDSTQSRKRSNGSDSLSGRKGSDSTIHNSIFSRWRRSNKVAPDSVCSEDQSGHTSSVVESFRRAMERHRHGHTDTPLGRDRTHSFSDSLGSGGRTRTHSFNDSIGTPSVIDSTLSAADRWQLASEALTSSSGRVTLGRLAQQQSLDTYESPTKPVHSLKWPCAKDVVSLGSGISSGMSDDNSLLSSDYEDESIC